MIKDVNKESLELHEKLQGKISITPTYDIKTKDDLSLVYTPGVAAPCLEINKDISKSFVYTRRWNTCAVITDGTAVLGLGDIGPEAGMPVMEGKCVLFKRFGNVDAIPICVRTKDVDEFVNAVKLIAGSFGGINLEDISAPRCFEIEKKLKESLDIPVFHDDQHGTACVVTAAMINALKVVKKDFKDIEVVISGAGAAGIAICKLLQKFGAKDIIMCNRKGAINRDTNYDNDAYNEIKLVTNKNNVKGTLKEVLKGKDVFIGVSAKNLLDENDIKTMNKDAIVMALANPIPEIMPDVAKKGGAKVVASGRSDFPNQVNNLLIFPGMFRGAFDAHATTINEEMKMAAALALASCVSEKDLSADNILPSVFDENVCKKISKAACETAIKTGVVRK